MASAGPPHLIFLLDLSTECLGKLILVLNSLYLLLNVDTHWENWKNYGILFHGPHGEESLFLIASQIFFDQSSCAHIAAVLCAAQFLSV